MVTWWKTPGPTPCRWTEPGACSDQTAVAWRAWRWAALIDGPYAGAVERSLLTVRSLTDNSVGAPVWPRTTPPTPPDRQ